MRASIDRPRCAERLATLLSTPKLVTKSGKPATFLSGGYQAVPEVTAFTAACMRLM